MMEDEQEMMAQVGPALPYLTEGAGVAVANVNVVVSASASEISANISSLVATVFQDGANGNFGSVHECLQEMHDLFCDLDEVEPLSFSQELLKLTNPKTSRLPELLHNCLNQEENVQIFMAAADVTLLITRFCHVLSDDDELKHCLNLIPKKALVLINSVDTNNTRLAYRLLFSLATDTDLLYRIPLTNLGPELVEAFINLARREPFYRFGVPVLVAEFLTGIYKSPDKTVALAVFQKALNCIASIVQNEASLPPTEVRFALDCLHSLRVMKKKGDVRLMIHHWIREAVPQLSKLLDHADEDVRVSAFVAFIDIIRADPHAAKLSVEAGLFFKVAKAMNQEEFNDVTIWAVRLLGKCVQSVHEGSGSRRTLPYPENWFMSQIALAEIPSSLSVRLLRSNIEARKCVEKICEFAPLSVARLLVSSGAALEWLVFIKEDPRKHSRYTILWSIIKCLLLTLKDDIAHYDALFQMILSAVGVDQARKAETAITKGELDSEPDVFIDGEVWTGRFCEDSDDEWDVEEDNVGGAPQAEMNSSVQEMDQVFQNFTL